MTGEEKGYELRCEEHEEYLLVEVTDTSLPLVEAVDLTNNAMRKLRETGCPGLILVSDVPMLMDQGQLNLLGNVIANTLPPDAKMALVDRTSMREAVKVSVVTAARKRGRAVEAFDTVEDAKDWVVGH